jgi:glycosyltransferase involved in cell wall biosynthesis
LTYTGTFYPSYGRTPDNLILALKRAVEKNPELRKSILVRFVSKLPPESRSLAQACAVWDLLEETGFVDYAKSLDYQRSADGLLLITGEDSNKEKWAVPGKTFEYLASGRPILALAAQDSFVAQVVVRTRSGIVVPPGDIDAIADAILKLFGEWRRSGALAYEPDKSSVARFSFPLIVERLAEVFGEIVGQRDKAGQPG